MKKILTYILALVLVLGLAVSASAVTGSYESFASAQYPYVLYVSDIYPDETYIITSSEPLTIYVSNSLKMVHFPSGTYLYYILQDDGTWNPWETTYDSSDKHQFTSTTELWSNYDVLKYGSTSVYHESDYSVCDGTSCPATDSNHDNICDDCHNVLALSLRSPLLEYAKTLAEAYSSGYPYYAVMAHPTDSEKLDLYISKAPMTSPDYENIVGSGMQFTTVYAHTDGTHRYAVLAAVESFTGDLVYSNHTIENFRDPPLAVVIQGVTGEAMEVTLPKMKGTMMTIVLCGVGCLALLILLNLFGKLFSKYQKG